MAINDNMRNILRLGLVGVLVVYLLVSLGFTSQISSMRTCRGMRIIVSDSLSCGFVTASELATELGTLFSDAAGRPLADISLDEIEQRLASIDKIECVNAMVMTNDSIYVEVTPLVPVIRVFDGRDSYYVNRNGKRIKADARYTMDVPIVKGNFIADDPAAYIPLAETLENSPLWRKLISMIEVVSPEDIYLIPDIKGQVIAFGNIDNTDIKLRRLEQFYNEVMPYKGWNHYDTISVKWNGQIVATRAGKSPDLRNIIVDNADETGDYENLGLNELIDPTVLVAKPHVNPPSPQNKS